MEINKTDTPVIQQWKKVKASYQEEIIFYRMGDFYELFYEDAINATRILNIQLTKRKNKNENIPMAGVPYHSANTYISRLLNSGFSVVICEQIGEAGKGLMERRVERVLTPATVFEEEFLEDKKINNLLSVFLDYRSKKAGISILDVSSGNFEVLEVEFKDLREELEILNPSEIITISKFKDHKIFEGLNVKFLTWDVDLSESYHYLLNHFSVKNLYCYNIENSNLIIKAAYNALVYAEGKINSNLSHISKIKLIEKNNFLYIDKNTKVNLDIFNKNKNCGLYDILDSCSSSMGSRLLYNWIDRPLNKKVEILNRQEAVEDLIEDSHISDLLLNIQDIERILTRISLFSAKPKELIFLLDFLKSLPNIKTHLSQYNCKKINNIHSSLKDFSFVIDLIERSINNDVSNNIKEGGYINDNYDEELDSLRNIHDEVAIKIINIENNERLKSGIDKLKVGYNKVSGYYIEIPSKFINKAPHYFIRKQTLKNVERFYTDELNELGDKVFSSKSKSILREKVLFDEILKVINNYYNELKIAANAIAEIDVLNNLSNKVNSLNLIKPNFNDNHINIKNGRHIVIENNIKEKFTGNDLNLNKNIPSYIITGANMGGKSTYMRQNALIIILSQIGSFVPADFCDIKIFNKMFSRIGASDNISKGLSTFMVEMTETANILNNSDENTFVLLDEIGRGTSTYEGVSIAWAVMKNILEKLNSFCLFATHYIEITELENFYNSVKNYHLYSYINDKGDLVFTHKLQEGISNNSYGIEVANLAGVPSNVIIDARLKLKTLEEIKEPFDNKDIVSGVLNEIDIDNINPREALDILYKMKELNNNKN